MAEYLDLNDYLFLNKLKTLLEIEQAKAVELHKLHAVLQVQETFFLTTIKSLAKRKFIQVGFFQRNALVHVVNWAEKYNQTQIFFVSLTKQGSESLTTW